ncbi:hypothetical protein [Acinetobacter indicus]|jgi:hypothetical protein|uniref:hypothetical protein n=1 Tax=Acinetobacter indicus TaxID=756892 RepID=UPI00209A951F|nr:hypothetical protein [Acinetobacter indicus]MCO8089150.1 hypothetical protein [Acinetobacter indicus]
MMRIILSTVTALALGFTLSSCASKAEREFVNGCRSGGGDKTTCKCVYQKLEKKYSETQLEKDLYLLSQNEDFQNDMFNSTMQCIRE